MSVLLVFLGSMIVASIVLVYTASRLGQGINEQDTHALYYYAFVMLIVFGLLSIAVTLRGFQGR